MNLVPPFPPIISVEALSSDDAYDVIASNIDLVNAQFEQHFRHEEISRDALRSYFVDYFCSQMANGGFSQFVYNSRWGYYIDYVAEGLAAIGATKHLELFERVEGLVEKQIGVEGLLEYFESAYFGENAVRDLLNNIGDDFDSIADIEDLVTLNSQWLRQLPNLIVLPAHELPLELQRRTQAIPDRDDRIAAALAMEPRYKKLVRALCKAAGHEFIRITYGDPIIDSQGSPAIVWHFRTDQGHFRLHENGGKAAMYTADTDVLVCEITVTEEFSVD